MTAEKKKRHTVRRPTPPATKYTRPDEPERTAVVSALADDCGSRYSAAEREWLRAVEAYQKRHGRKFLAHVDYLRVAIELGYRLPQEPAPPGEQGSTPPAG